MKRIFHGAAVITGRRHLGKLEVILDGAVAVEDGRIVDVGDLSRLRERSPHAVQIGSPSNVLMPGFVDGHHHQGVPPIRLGARAMSLEHVFTHRRSLRGPALYEDTLYGATQLLAGGVTTVNHLHVGRRGPWQQWREDADTVLRAYADAGIRVNFTFNFRDQNRLLYDGDGWFTRELPGPLAEEMREFLQGQEVPRQAYLDELFVGLWESNGRNRDPLARISLAPHNLHWCSDEAISDIVETARRYDVHVNMHLLESPRQKLYAGRRTGTTAIKHLHNLGVLDDRLTLLHAVWATEPDVDLLAAAKTRVCTSVSSNLLMGSGIAPLNLMHQRGVPLSLGLDEGGLSGDCDIFADMRLTQGIHHVPGADSETITPDLLVEMGTSGAAASTEFRGEIGVLEPGRFADLLTLDWEAVNDPVGPTGPTVVDDLVYKAVKGHIVSVIVGGEEVMHDGRHSSIDRRALSRLIGAQLRSAPTQEEQRRLALLERVRPHADGYWRHYGQPEPGRPHYIYNDCC
jgi:Cytosine deaminase and related metal-dependent hydrolases